MPPIFAGSTSVVSGTGKNSANVSIRARCSATLRSFSSFCCRNASTPARSVTPMRLSLVSPAACYGHLTGRAIAGATDKCSYFETPRQPIGWASEQTHRSPRFGGGEKNMASEEVQKIIDQMGPAIGADSGLGGTLKFDFGEPGSVFIDGKSTPNTVSDGEGKNADCTITVGLDTF